MKTALATVSISGTLREKMEAASKAGFQGVEIFENDLTQFSGSPIEVGKMAKDLGLKSLLFSHSEIWKVILETFKKACGNA